MLVCVGTDVMLNAPMYCANKGKIASKIAKMTVRGFRSWISVAMLNLSYYESNVICLLRVTGNVVGSAILIALYGDGITRIRNNKAH